MVDVTDATFETEVLARSEQVPVVVDLWAPWCGPCKTLGPILDKVVGETGGKVVLAKINVDENPQASQVFQVQSIPAVYALRDRKVVNGFMGAQPEAKVAEFVHELLPPDVTEQADSLVAQGDEASLRAALELDPVHAGARTALAKVMVGDGRIDEGLALIEGLPDSLEVAHIRAVAAQGGAVSTRGIQAELEGLLDRVKADDDARKRFLEQLELLDPDDPATGEWRRKLTARLF
ncbi:MAG: tetratricopeptide repeat protein [Microthrixaceae bacterium]